MLRKYMLDLKFIREHPEEVKENCANRGVTVDVDELLRLDEERRRLVAEIDAGRAELNQASKTKPDQAQIEPLKALGEHIKAGEAMLKAVLEKLNQLLLAVPNMTHPAVKVSSDEDDNPVLGKFGRRQRWVFTPQDHLTLAQQNNWVDFERAAKVTGAKFYYLKGALARLELALVQYALDIITTHGYELMTTPDLAKTDIIERLGFNPKGESTQVYNIEQLDLSLIGTAEITLGGYHADEILSVQDLPKKYVGLSHCFRTEAGSYSKFSKGLFRVHQFTKVEMFIYCAPEQSEALHQELLEIEKEIFNGLKLPFRVIDHCTADLGNPSQRTFDLEVWLPGKPNKKGKLGDWAEATSTSNCADYQARGLNIKYQTTDGNKEFVHTLNGTGVATTRALLAILENYQQADGTVSVPKVLQKYFNKQRTL